MELDTAASAVWIAHGLVMNGGVLHCVQALSKRELRTTIAGYRLFGLSLAADVLMEASRVPLDEIDTAEPRLDAAYAGAIPSDEVLATQVNSRFPADQPAATGLAGHAAIEWAVDAFTESSAEAARLSSVPGKTRAQHRAHDRAESAVKELLRQWDTGGHLALIDLLSHNDDAVRGSAAAYLAVSDPESALPVLEELQETSMNAHMTLFVIGRGMFSDPLTRLRAQL
jgi:hypothetical protein